METLPEPKTSVEPNVDVILHHIDKLHTTQIRVWESLNRIVFTQIALSIILIALSARFVALEEGAELGGMRFKVSLAAILIGGSLMVTLLSIAVFTQTNHSDRFGNEIKRLYASLGYELPRSTKLDTDAFEDPGFYMSVIVTARAAMDRPGRFVPFYGFITAIFTTLALLILLPVSAQIIAGFRVATLLGWRWWVVLLFVVLLAVTVSYFIFAFISSEEVLHETSEHNPRLKMSKR